MFDYAHFCIDRDIIQFDENGYKINPSSWQRFNWYWDVRYCEFLTLDLWNVYYKNTNPNLAQITDQFYMFMDNYAKLRNIQSNPELVKQFKYQAYKRALKKVTDDNGLHYNFSFFNVDIIKTKIQ